MCSCDYDEPDAFWQAHHKAKKRHKCSECRGWIESGERYWRTRGVWDGRPSTYSVCADCEQLICWAGEHDDCLCWGFGRSHGDIVDMLSDRGDRPLLDEARSRIEAIKKKRRDPVAA